MIRVVFLALTAFAFGAGCGTPGEVTEADQRAMEKQNSAQGYEDAMRKAGRGKELEEQKRMEAERQGADR